jgi:hypothetical protein
MANIPKVWNGTAFIELEAAATVAPAASTTVVGIVQLSDSTSTTSSVLAATPTAVKSAYDLANAAIPKTLTTTTGDIIYASSANTPARLGIGTASQVLSVVSGVPSWTTPAGGGGLTLIATATPSAATTVSFTSIPGTYKHLMIVWQDVFQSSATASDGWGVRLNNDTTAGLHTYYNRGLGQSSITGDRGSSTLFTSSSAELRMVIPKTTTGSTTYDSQARGVFMVYRYTESSAKFCEWRSSGDDALSFGNGRFGGTSAITQVDFVRASTQTIDGKFYLYGVS